MYRIDKLTLNHNDLIKIFYYCQCISWMHKKILQKYEKIKLTREARKDHWINKKTPKILTNLLIDIIV